MTSSRSRRPTGPDKLTVEAVYGRSLFDGLPCCELCGVPVEGTRGVEHHIHHRRPRRMGGSQLADTNSVVNLLLLDASCHERVERERTAAYAGGWLVRQGERPADVPVLIRAERWCRLTDDAGYEPVELPEVIGGQ